MAPRIARTLAAYARLRPDVVNSHNWPAHRYAVLARPFRATIALTIHGENSATTARASRPIVDGVIAVSTRVGERFLERHPRWERARFATIDNGVQLPPSPARGSGGGKVIATVARLDAVKDLGTLLAALARLPDVELLLVGDGPERVPLQELAAALGLGARVRFLGYRRDVAQLLDGADLFALSSLTEGMSLAVLEAMAAGLPVVGTRGGGMPDVVDDGVTGLLVPPRDPAALAAVLRTLLDDPVRRAAMGAAGRARVEQKFSLATTAQAYVAAYGRWG
jgi:glycosyltransferase involved in cell wall biosynthesis